MSDSQLPKFINAHHIGGILKISYSEACDLLDQGILPIIILGRTKRVLTRDFNRWLNSQRVTYG